MRPSSRLALTVSLVILGWSISASAVPAAALVQRARLSAARDDWNDAARALEELVSAGIDSSDVLYDLGTTYAHARRYGEAVWRLEQVARRSPFAFDAQQNLRATRLRIAHRDAGRSGRAVVETALPLAAAFAEALPRDWAIALALVLELALAVCAFAWRRGRGGELGRVAGAAGTALLTGAVLVTGAMVIARQVVPPAGIILHDGVRLLRAPTADAIAEIPVREGERVEIVDHEALFVRVRASAGEGWLASRDLGALEE